MWKYKYIFKPSKLSIKYAASFSPYLHMGSYHSEGEK